MQHKLDGHTSDAPRPCTGNVPPSSASTEATVRCGAHPLQPRYERWDGMQHTENQDAVCQHATPPPPCSTTAQETSLTVPWQVSFGNHSSVYVIDRSFLTDHKGTISHPTVVSHLSTAFRKCRWWTGGSICFERVSTKYSWFFRYPPLVYFFWVSVIGLGETCSSFSRGTCNGFRRGGKDLQCISMRHSPKRFFLVGEGSSLEPS